MFIDYNSYFCTLLVYNITIDWLIDTTRSFFPLGADFSWLLVGKFCPCCFHWLIEHNKTGNTLSSKTVEQAVNQCSLNECFRENQEDYRVLEIPTCSSIHDLWGKRRFFFSEKRMEPKRIIGWPLRNFGNCHCFNSFHKPISEISRDRGYPSTYWKLSTQFRDEMASKLHEKQKLYTGTPSKYV